MATSTCCDVSEIRHDVFISFTGIDVRRGLISHLKRELHRKHIDAYVDERLDKGGEISSSLLRAIEGSKILLVVFSKHYASSHWCLEELAKMIECMETNKQIVLPVFFNIDPSHVRHQYGDYGYALAEHEEEFKENMLKVQSWRSALKKAGRLSGFHYPTNYENESDLVDEIVEDISVKLSELYPSESNGLVGIDQNVTQVQSLLRVESNEVLFVGIWGMGGIGKTTIARAIFDKCSLQYDGCCFFNVREELEQHGFSNLRERLIYELLEGEGLHTNKARFFSSALRMLGRKKVMVVLDDVNTSEELRYLVTKPVCFGAGSRVIITSRDQDVLTSGGLDQIHEVKEMKPLDSLKLFCLIAFNESQPKMGYEKLTEEVLKIAPGNPLALKVLGAEFHSRSAINTWNCALSKFKKYPNEKIQSVLRFSYDGLHEVEKKAFLDIAFFFQEDTKAYVIEQLDAWGLHGASGVEVLQRKALITVSNENIIQMHDLIRQMGCEIVRQECITHPGRRTRLRDKEEVYKVLRNKLGSDKVEGMQVDVFRIKDLSLKVGTFKKMPCLRFLKFYLPDDNLFLPPNPDGTLRNRGREIRSSTSISLTELTGSLGDLECSDMLDQQFKILPDGLLCLRSTYYLKLSKSTGQDSGKPKLHVLFDSLRFYERISVGKLKNSDIEGNRMLFLYFAGFNFLFSPFLLRRPWFHFLFSFRFAFFCTLFLYLSWKMIL
ncbi:disease resistance protein RUN1 isoform X2 [Vigna angularis]|uniref:disease resistance protein RUN1 isoform X2 n=1 Tax=Phaseolus angularis TaxID=3914 RepID=UPI000809C40B|nr:disease resistance protein RUN1 isoform X2 [Vigna angularis]